MRLKGIATRLFWLVAILSIIQTPILAYHHFYIKSGAAYLAVKWRTLPVNFLVDNGPTNIMLEIATAANTWNAIPTAKDVIGTLSLATVDFNGANFGTAWGKLTGDGQQEVVLDEDGTAFTAVGLNAATVNGYGPTLKVVQGGLGAITDAFLLLNGTRTNFDRPSTETHELGHIQGIAHSAVAMFNSASFAGERGNTAPSDALDPIAVTSVPTMHPFSTNTGTSRRTLKPDDIAALSELYPDTGFDGLGSITGTVTRCTDNSPLTGVHVRAVNTADPTIQLSRFSGFDGNGAGSYTIRGLPAGSYRVMIEGMGTNGFTIDRFGAPPLRADNDFPTMYYNHTCFTDLPGTPTSVTVAGGVPTTGINMKVGGVDLAFVVDNTGSMGGEINAVKKILSNYITTVNTVTTAKGLPFPTVAVVTFIDTSSVNLISNSPTALQAAVSAMGAGGGGDCPEPSNAAVISAGRLLKKKGIAMLFTDADSDAVGPSRTTVDQFFRAKSLRLHVILDGSCSGGGLSPSAPSSGPNSAPAEPTRGYSSNIDEYTPDPPLGPESSVVTFTDESVTSGGIFTSGAGIKTGSPTATTAFINTGTNIAVSSAIPAVGIVSPGSGPQGATMGITITGSNTNFQGSSVVSVSGGGITVGSTSVASPTSMTANLSIASGATTGFDDVIVTTNLGGGTTEVATGVGAFQITTPPATPTVIGTVPAQGGQGQTLNVTISAMLTHFVAGTSTVSFGAGVTVNSLTVSSPTSAVANVTISGTASVGFHNVTVTTGAEVATQPGSGPFLVATLAPIIPIISTIAPNSGNPGQTLTVTITGLNTNFVNGVSVVSFSDIGITVNSVNVTSLTSLTANISIDPSASLTFRDVLVTTGGEVATALGAFQVFTAAAPPPPPPSPGPSAPPPPPPPVINPDFAMSVTPTSQSVAAGASTTYTLAISSFGGFSGTVALACAGLPKDAQCSFSSNPAPIGSVTLTVTTAATTPPSVSTITITGTGATGSTGAVTAARSVSVTLAVTLDFLMNVSPRFQSVAAGASATYTLALSNPTTASTSATYTPLALSSATAASSTVSLACSGLPSGAQCAFSPNPAPVVGNVTLTVTTAATTPAGTSFVTITGTDVTGSQSVNFGLVVTPALAPIVRPPAVTAAGITNAASFAAGLVPGGIVTIFGTNLTTGVTGVVVAVGLPLPTSLKGTSVTVNGIQAPLFAIANVGGNEQINLQIPLEVAGQATATIIVTNNGVAGTGVQVPILNAQPGIFTLDGQNGAFLHGADFSPVSAATPAAKGETVILYATNLGPVTPPVPTNLPAPVSPLSTVQAGCSITVGGVPANLAGDFCGLAPTFIGLYQANFTIPLSTPSGPADVVLQVDSQKSNIAKIMVQ